MDFIRTLLGLIAQQVVPVRVPVESEVNKE